MKIKITTNRFQTEYCENPAGTKIIGFTFKGKAPDLGALSCRHLF